MRLQDVADLLRVSLEHPADPELQLRRVASLEEAGPQDLSFVSSLKEKAIAAARASKSGCLLVPPDFDNQPPRSILRVPDPRAAIAAAIQAMHPSPHPEPGVHPTAVVAPDARLGADVSIGPHVTIGSGTEVGDGTAIGAGTTIGDDVSIGARCLLHPGVTLYRNVSIGDRCILHSGSVIGADGFGFVMLKDDRGGHYEKFPQVGRVEIGNDVEIGANSCIDRAALGVTSIGDGVKLDNMVHIGHNCKIGRHVVIAAQTGLSGGVEVGEYAVIGGQVGIGDKVKIESGAVLGSGSGVLTSKIVRAGQVLWGTPARPLKEYLAQLAALSKLAKKKRGK